MSETPGSENQPPGGAEGVDELPALSGRGLWGAGLLLAAANFVAVLDLTITNVSVPTIAGSMGASISQGTWIITSYAVAEAITVPLTGWLASRFGPSRVFVAALLAFALVSFLCALSPTIGILVGMRVLQGVCGGPLMPLSQTLLLRLFPRRLQAAAMGLWGVTTLVAPIAGPMLGGVLCDGFGWPVIFLINVPVAAATGLVAWRVLVRGRFRPVKLPFDGVGLVLLIAWVGLLQVMLDLGKDLDWFGSPLIMAMAIGSALSFAAFVIWELTSDHPIVNLRVFRHRGFWAAMIIFACALGGFFATNVLTPLWLQTNLGYTATQAGLATGATGILAVAAAPITAMLVSRIDARIVACAGVGWLMVTSLLRGMANTDMTFWQVWSVLVLVGAAMPTFFMPLTLLAMGAVNAEETADASGLSSLVRTLSGAFATSIVTTRWETYTAAFHADLAARSPNLGGFLALLGRRGLAPGQALQVVNEMVDRQSILLATNRLFWDIAIVFGVGVCLVWLLPRPSREADLTGVH
jgi:DHA2 family multidrug resistance protein